LRRGGGLWSGGEAVETVGAIARRRARQAALDGDDVEPWGKFWDTTTRLQREMDGLNLDPKLVVLDALEAARQASAARAA